MPFPLVHALAQQPHTVYVFEETDFATYAAQVGEICGSCGFGDARNAQYSADERPGAGADEGPVVTRRRYRSDGGCGVVTRGSDHFGVAEFRKRCQFTREISENRATRNDFRCRGNVQAKLFEDRVTPIVRTECDQAGVRGIRVFADALAAKAIGHEFGDVEPRGIGAGASQLVRIELVESVDTENLDASQFVEPRRRKNRMNFALRAFGAWVAVTECVLG